MLFTVMDDLPKRKVGDNIHLIMAGKYIPDQNINHTIGKVKEVEILQILASQFLNFPIEPFDFIIGIPLLEQLILVGA